MKKKEIITPGGEAVAVAAKPKKISLAEKWKGIDWEKWKRKNLNWNGIGRFCWIILRFIIVFGICFTIIYPYIVKLIVSFMSTADIDDATVMYIPREISTYFIQKASYSMNYWVSMLNTALLSLAAAALTLVVSTMVGYGFARFKFVGSNLLFFMIILTLIIPAQTIMIPLYVNFNSLGLINTFWPIVVLSATGLGLKNGLYIYMMRQFFRGMPKELEMSAYIDGAGHFRTFFSIMLPNASNMMITIFLFSFTWQWTDTTFNSMLFPRLEILTNTISDVMKASATSGSSLESSTQTQALLDTSSLMLIFPLLIVFLFAQRYFIQSIERSGLVE